MKSLLLILCFLSIYPAKAQLIDFYNLINMVPPIPNNLSTASQEEISSFKSKVDSVGVVLEKIQNDFRRVNNPDPKNIIKNAEMYFDVTDRIGELCNEKMPQFLNMLAPEELKIAQEEDAQWDEILKEMNAVKYHTTREQDKEFERRIYNVRLEFSKKKVQLYLKYAEFVRNSLQNLSADINKVDHSTLPDYLDKTRCTAVWSAEIYLNVVKLAYGYNVGKFRFD